MSGNQPPQGPWQQGPYEQGPYPQGWQPAGPAQPPPPKKRRTGLILGSAAAALVIVLAGGGVVAFNALSGGGPQPAEALPDTAIAYARVDLDPSASQKLDLLRLLRRVPEFSEATGIDGDKDDLRKVLFEKAMQSSSCDLDYADDIKPWIGDRAAVAAVPVDDAPAPVFVLQTKDQDAAKDAVDALADCAGGTEIGSALVDDYLLIAQDQAIADEVATETKDGPLSEDDTFKADMDKLGDQGVASFWADGDGFAELTDELGSAAGSETVSGPDFESVAGALRAGSDYIELAAVTHGKSAIKSDGRSDVGDLPDSTVLAASFAGGGEMVDEGWTTFTEAMGGVMYGFQSNLDAFEQSTGLSLPEDLTTIVGDNITLAVDERGLDSVTGMAGLGDLSELGIGISMTTDKGEINDVLDRINAKLATGGAPELASQETDDGLVVATSDDYAEDLAGGGSLGSSDTFETVVPEAEKAVALVYLDVDKATEVATEIAEQSGQSTEEIGMLDPIEAVGFSVTSGDDGRNTSLLRVSFD